MTSAQGSFFITGGTLRHDAPSYVERRADRDLLEGLLKNEFCYVLTSRQMGKSSLMVRTAIKLREHGTHIIAMDLTAVGQNLTAEQWYDGLLMRMGRQLRLEEELEEFWRANERLGPCQRLFAALRDVVMARCPGPLAIFVDEIDTVRSLPFSIDEFFAAIRECYNRRAEDAEFGRLTFCLLGVATPSDLIRDTRTTPFNIGRRIELHDFTEAEAAPLALGFKHLPAARRVAANGHAPANGRIGTVLRRILYWTGGHPYLTQRLCHAIAEDSRAEDETRVDEVCEELFLSHRARERDDNLLFVRERLLRSEVDVTGLLELYGRTRSGRRVADDETSPLVSVLRLSGIVKAEAGRLRERNRIYSRVFDRHWVRAHLPDADLRRQRAAFYRGVIRITGIAAVVVAALTGEVIYVRKQAANARLALAQSNFSQAQTWRVSGVAGQRYESLDALRRARSGFTNDAVIRDEAIACLALVDLKLDLVHTNFPASATAIALSPDLEHYAVGEDSGAIAVMRMKDAQANMRLSSTGLPVAWMALSRDARFLAAQYSGNGGHRFVVWNLADARPVVESTNQVHPGAVDFSTDGTLLAVVLEPEALDVISLPAGQLVTRLALRQGTNTPRVPDLVRFDPSGRRLAESAPGSQRAYIWDLADQTATNGYGFLASEITALAWSPQGYHLAAAGRAGLTLWDLQYGRSRPLAQAQTEAMLDLAFNPDGTLLAAVDTNRTLRLWCPATARHVTESLPASATGRVYFSRDGRRLGLAGLHTGVRLWQVLGGEEYRVLRAAAEFYVPFNSLNFDPEGRMLASASDMGVFFWDVATGRTMPALPVHSIRSLCVHPGNGDLYASGPLGLFHWRRSTTRSAAGVEYAFAAPETFDLPGGLEVCTLPHEGKQAVVLHEDHVHWFELGSPAVTAPLRISGAWKALALSPDGGWLAMWSGTNNEIEVRSMQNPSATNGPVKTIPAGRHFAFTPDSRFLLTGLGPSNQLWSTKTWTATASFGGLALTREVNAPVAFGRLSDDGRTLFAITDEPGLIRLYELTGTATKNMVPTFRFLARLEDPDRRPIVALTFNPQGSRLAAATTVHTIQVWDLARVQRGLAELGMAEALPVFTGGLDAPLTVTFDAAPPRNPNADHWLRVEELTFELAEAAAADASVRASQLVDRGTLYLDRLDRPATARADFDEALRLNPGDARISELRERANEKLRKQQPDNP